MTTELGRTRLQTFAAIVASSSSLAAIVFLGVTTAQADLEVEEPGGMAIEQESPVEADAAAAAVEVEAAPEVAAAVEVESAPEVEQAVRVPKVSGLRL